MKSFKKWLTPIGFITPAMLMIFGVILYSVIYNIYLSFYKVGLGGISSRKWIGFKNYIDIFKSNTFWEVVFNTVIWVVVITVILELLAIISATLLNQKIRGRGIYRMILLLPWVIPGVVTGILWKYMYDAHFGVINDILMRLGLIDKYEPWLAQGSTALYAIMFSYIWKVFPLAMIIILGALQGISDEILEAAEIDGAGSLQKYRYIILPLLKNVIITTTIFTIITAFNSFDLTYIMTGGGPVNKSEILGMFIYDLGFKQFNFGRSSTTATIMFLVSIGLIVYYVYRQSKTEDID